MEVGVAKRSGIRTDVTIEYRQVSTYNHVALHCTCFGAGALTYTCSLTFTRLCALQYGGEQDMYHVMQLVDNELSEPYSIFTYRCRRNAHAPIPRSCASAPH